MEFGKGPTLIEACPYLRDRAERIERILDVVDRNSVIEGLPPLGEEERNRIRELLRSMTSAPAPMPRESPPSSGHSPS